MASRRIPQHLIIGQFNSAAELHKRGYLTINEAADLLGISIRHIFRFVNEKQIESWYASSWKGKPYQIVRKEDVDLIAKIRGKSKNITQEMWDEFRGR